MPTLHDWKKYRKIAEINARPYVPGEDLEAQGITINRRDFPPRVGGMIAHRLDDPSDTWYISPEAFKTYTSTTPS